MKLKPFVLHLSAGESFKSRRIRCRPYAPKTHRWSTANRTEKTGLTTDITMLTSETKRRIDACRDVLVGKLPQPSNQVELITLALIYKFMDDLDEESVKLGGKRSFFTEELAKYRWAISSRRPSPPTNASRFFPKASRRSATRRKPRICPASSATSSATPS